jgi:hypothetical protein
MEVEKGTKWPCLPERLGDKEVRINLIKSKININSYRRKHNAYAN